MNLEQLAIAVGEKSKEQVAIYGPSVVSMAKDDINKWLQYVYVGKYMDAYDLYLKQSSDATFLTEWDTEHTLWVKDNNANNAKLEMSRKIAQGFCAAMLPLFLAMVGL